VILIVRRLTRMATTTFTCPSCGRDWPENYCPECEHTIERPATPPALSRSGIVHTGAFKWAAAALACTLLFAAWRAFVVSSQRDAALRISGACKQLERSAPGATDPEALALEIQSLQIYYGLNIGKVSDSPLQKAVRRDYEHTMTNSFAALHRLATNNASTHMSPWLADWLNRYER
jgi:hypothetical protein